MKIIQAIVMALMVTGITACSSTGDKKDDEAGDVVVEERGTDGDGYEGATTSGVSGYDDLSAEALNDPNNPISQRVIYFAYDSSDVVDEDQGLVAAHASFLAANPDVKISVEGHSDERGAREYNIGLGDRRAQSVRRMLEFQGVSAEQISVVSYGEEKPAVEGHDESAWSLNRRVELVYVGY